MKIFNMSLFGWPDLPQDAVRPGKYPVPNTYFDPRRGYELFQKAKRICPTGSSSSSAGTCP